MHELCCFTTPNKYNQLACYMACAWLFSHLMQVIYICSEKKFVKNICTHRTYKYWPNQTGQGSEMKQFTLPYFTVHKSSRAQHPGKLCNFLKWFSDVHLSECALLMCWLMYWINVDFIAFTVHWTSVVKRLDVMKHYFLLQWRRKTTFKRALSSSGKVYPSGPDILCVWDFIFSSFN